MARNITHPWRPVNYGHNHTRFPTHVALAQHLWKQDPKQPVKAIAKKVHCTLQLAYYAVSPLRREYLNRQRKLTQTTWRRANYGSVQFKSRSDKVRYYLTHCSNLSQAEIAERCNVSGPRVSQLASELK